MQLCCGKDSGKGLKLIFHRENSEESFMPQNTAAEIRFTRKQTVRPQKVGMRKAASVQRRLSVSFRMVSRVVAQGQCIRKNRAVQSTVVQVQPF